MCNSGKGHQFPLFGWGMAILTNSEKGVVNWWRVAGRFPHMQTMYVEKNSVVKWQMTDGRIRQNKICNFKNKVVDDSWHTPAQADDAKYITGSESYTYTVHGRIFGDFPAKNTVYTPYIYGSGQPLK